MLLLVVCRWSNINESECCWNSIQLNICSSCPVAKMLRQIDFKIFHLNSNHFNKTITLLSTIRQSLNHFMFQVKSRNPPVKSVEVDERKREISLRYNWKSHLNPSHALLMKNSNFNHPLSTLPCRLTIIVYTQLEANKHWSKNKKDWLVTQGGSWPMSVIWRNKWNEQSQLTINFKFLTFQNKIPSLLFFNFKVTI